ncbi:MAG: glutamine-hydrolyzing GMP synthase [Fibrobacteria bacterium]|nr:glutamine-hydrolyzing GMP synthase [Fibrobacteria bacterium]
MYLMEKIAVIDFGGQYAHLIANRIRRLGVYSEVIPPTSSLEDTEQFSGLVFSGGPASVYASDIPEFNAELISAVMPILGICYGHQLICRHLAGEVTRGKVHEFGPSTFTADTTHPLLKDVSPNSKVWMSHGDEVSQLPEDFTSIGSTSDCRNAAVACDDLKIYGLQFHPEVTHTEEGIRILDNFINLCKVQRKWNMKRYFQILEERVNEQCKGKKVFLLVSGGVDSTVAFALLNKILGPDQVIGLHIDNGLMRKNESSDIIDYMKKEGFNNLIFCDATDTFLSRLQGKIAPEEKRNIIGATFIEVLKERAASLKQDGENLILAQGTTYPDTIESGGTKNAATIKTHHNRVLEALNMLEKGTLIEPLAELYKDEVRELGETLGIPAELIWRHPFPGPGLGVRLLCHTGEVQPVEETATAALQPILKKYNTDGIILPINSVGVQGDSRTYAHPCLLYIEPNWVKCEQISTDITNNIRDINRVIIEIGSVSREHKMVQTFCDKNNLEFLRQADDICTQMLFENNLYRDIWQMPVVLLPLQANGKPIIVMRPIYSAEAMTADFAKIDANLLKKLWQQLESIGTGALWYDITPKPPGTIEWE